MSEARKGVINIRDLNSDTLSSMIHYIYTGQLADGWQDLDIPDVAKAADMYDLQGWLEIFCSELNTEEVSDEKVAEMIIAGSRYEHSASYRQARLLMRMARARIRRSREITLDEGFREKLRGEDPIVLVELLAIM